jgi:hypothetical protein
VAPPSPLPSLSASRGGNKPMAEAKLTLLYWVRSQLEDYVANHIITTVQDFSRSWRSGLAFCLLVHRYDPDLLPTLFTDHIQHASDKQTWSTMLNLAFNVAEQYMNVPKYLEPADLLIEFPHEPSVMMYVSEMYKVMSKLQLESTEQRQKRYRDIALVATNGAILGTQEEEDLGVTIQEELVITPPNSTILPETTNDETPGTPHPEVFDHQNIYQQLDLLDSLIDAQSLQDSQLLENASEMINQLDPASEQGQILIDRYTQLRAKWEQLSKRLEVQPHISNYVNESTLALQLKETIPKNDQLQPLHPLDGTLAIADEFERSLSHLSAIIKADPQEDDVDALNSTQATCHLFRRGVTFAQITSAINDELDVIEQLMTDSGTSTVTDELIQSLEKRIHIVSATIQGVRDEYGHDLLLQEDEFYTRFMTRIDELEDRYETVRDWVDQVRVWFLEAERIRAWIDQRIHVIEERNENDTFNPVSRDITIADASVIQLHEEHERLKQEVARFDADDMNRLRGHVKMLAPTDGNDKELTPADTSTIEITFTTLNMLERLTRLLDNRSHWIASLLSRVEWEDAFSNAVQWIARTDGEMDGFLRGKARWSEKDESSYTMNHRDDENEEERANDGGIEGVIKTLVSLEHKIADFNTGTYSDVLSAYEKMETLRNESLPDYLEMRQVGFEKAFGDLMKRSTFSRLVVEQLLYMINTVSKFKELRDIGELLRQNLAEEIASGQNEDDDVYAERVQVFKEESARLITNATTNFPYPNVPEMSTAIGANDAHDSEITNQNIKSAISNYSMSLALIADGLDQLLSSRYQTLSLQQRASEAFEGMTRIKTWMNERIKILNKPRFEIMLYDASMSTSASSSSSSSDDQAQQRKGNNSTHSSSPKGSAITASIAISTSASSKMADDEELLRIEKERDNIASRLHQMENDDLMKLFDTVRNLEYDVDASNAVSIDRNALINGVEDLETSLAQLKDLLVLRGLQLDALKRRRDWENQWSKSNSHLQTIARKMCDFNVKKVRYDPSKENVDKPSYAGDQEMTQSLHFLQDRVAELGERHLTSLQECYTELTASYAKLSQDNAIMAVPDFISNKQADLKFKYDDLKHLTVYTSDLLVQRSTITEFLLRAQDAQHEGEKIKDTVSKKTRRIMVKEEEDGPTLDTRVAQFKQEIKDLWEECGKTMSYPVYSGNWLKSSHNAPTQQHHSVDSNSNTTNSAYRSQVRAQVKSLLDKKMEELNALEKAIDQSLVSYRDADRMKALVNQYEKEACELGQWINEHIEILKRQHIDVSAESFLARGMNISDLKKARLDLFMKVDTFEGNKVKALHDRIAQLVQDSVEKKKNQSVDVSSAAHHLGEVMEHLSQLKRGLSDQAVTLEAAAMRADWEQHLQLGIARLEEMNEQLRLFTAKKNQLIAQDELSEEQVHSLQQDLTRLMNQKNKFQKSVLPGIQMSYDAFVEYFPKLSRPIATPDHLEARMESLSRTSIRLQENVEARTRELDLIKQRMRWEDTVKQALAYLEEKELLIENFVEEKARWQNDSLSSAHNDDDEEVVLRTEWSNIFSDFKNYEQDVIEPLQKRFKSLVSESNDYYNNTSVTLLPNAFMKKMQDVQAAQDRTSYYLTFSNDVVSQRCLVSAFILRTAQLEQSAEMIREEFITSKVAGGNAHIAGLLESHNERLEKFKAGIDDVKHHLATSIPFPVRSLDNISTQAKLKDETTNAVIHETIDIRNARLDELWSSLQLLLETKERVSRRRLSLHSYKKKAQAAETWIDSRREILSKSDSYISAGNKTIDIEKLKEAVSQADGVEQSMKAADTVLTTLTTAFEKCISDFDDKSLDNEEVQDEDHETMMQEISSVVHPTQKRISQVWDSLLIEATETKKSRAALLVENRIQSWLTALKQLASRIVTDPEAIITDEMLSFWTDELDFLENKEYQNLTSELETNKEAFSNEKLSNVKNQLEDGRSTIESIHSQLNELQNELHLGQLIKKYLVDISKMQDLIQIEMDRLTQIDEQHKAIDYEATPEARNHTQQDLTSKYKQATDTITNLKEGLDEVHGQYNAILENDHGYKNDDQDKLTKAWEALSDKELCVSALVARSSKWINKFNLLANLIQELDVIQNDLTTAPPHLYDQFNQKFSKVESLLAGELNDLTDDLLKDIINLPPFEAQRSALTSLLNQLKLILGGKLEEQEKTSLIEAIKTIVDELYDACIKQVALANEHCKTYGFDNCNQSGIEETIKACSDIIQDNTSVYNKCQNELDSLRSTQCTRLTADLNCPQEDVNKLLTPIMTAVEDLNKITLSEEECLSIARLLCQYTNNQVAIMDTIDSCINKLEMDKDSNQLVLELESQLESIEETIQELSTLGNSITGFSIENLKCSSSRMQNVASVVNNGRDQTANRYTEFKLLLQEASINIAKTSKRRNIIIKLGDSIGLVNDMIDRFKSFKLTGKGIPSEIKELEELCRDCNQSMKAKSDSLRALMNDYTDLEHDQEITDLRNELSTVTAQLDALISLKRKEASDEGDLSDFLRIMNEFDEQIVSLHAAIEHASPHYSGMSNNKFIKADLQALLKSLVAAYKKHQQAINAILEQARVESKKQFLDHNHVVAEGLQKANKRWAQAQSAAASRERELQTCISQLDHEFFTKLAVAKTTPRASRRVLQSTLAPSALKRYPTPATNNGRYMGTVSPFNSTSRREEGGGSKRSSKTPLSASSSTSRLRAAYIPDPDNELDMKLGHIVNSSPYRVTVKIVPDQVGKYWFGDVNPRLVYCRILPSQLVMVRVGGGWVELSK